jgi:hypothetical protein
MRKDKNQYLCDMMNNPFPVDTVVRLKKTGEFAIIKRVAFLNDEKSFLHYEGTIEGRGKGLYALYPDDIELECLPPDK